MGAEKREPREDQYGRLRKIILPIQLKRLAATGLCPPGAPATCEIVRCLYTTVAFFIAVEGDVIGVCTEDR